MTPNLHVSAEDAVLIRAIVDRARDFGLVIEPRKPALDAMMDLTAVHANGCPLRLSDFLTADPANFAHDFTGIQKHLDRDTGRLDRFFHPRFAMPAREAQQQVAGIGR